MSVFQSRVLRSQMLLALAGFLLPAASVYTAESMQREFAAHVHGEAKLFIALEGSDLEINFESPAMSLLGFEHRAETREQIAAVEKATETLNSAENLFEFSGADCELQETEVNFSSIANADHVDHDHAAENVDDEGSDESHSDDSEHSDISAHYAFTCSDGGALEAISTSLVSHSFGIERVDVMWVTDTSQGAIELTPNNRTVLLME